MVAASTRASSAAKASSSKLKSFSHSSSSSSASSPASRIKHPVTKFLVQSRSKKLFAKTKKNKGSNKFRDSEKREQLDGQTIELLQEQPASSKKGEGDPFSYNLPSRTDQKRTRAQIDEAALALDLLMKS
ncbi:hypothetical protein NDA13_001488 [Ustilago tritici]|nr:hypothetical protein NDA13_001488 [Ustilago tritici]